MKKGIFTGREDRILPAGVRATGTARVRELLGRDLLKYFTTGFYALLTASLYGFALWAGMVSGSILLVLLAGLLGGAVAGPFLCGLTDTIFRTLRDEPGFWHDSYRKALKRNGLQAAAAGAILGAVLAGQVFCLYYGRYVVPALLGVLLLSCIALYAMAQIVLVQLKLGQIFKNALVLMTAHPLLTLKAAAVVDGWAFLLWLFAPLSVLFWVFAGLWLPLLAAYLILYGMLDETFEVEAGCEELQKNKYGNE